MTTAQKRFSALLVALPMRFVLPIPDGTIDASERAMAAYLYAMQAGEVAAEPLTPKRITLMGTSRQRLTLTGTASQRMEITGTSGRRLTLRGTDV